MQSPWLSALWGSAPAVQATVLSSVFTSLCAAVGLPVPSVQRALVSRVTCEGHKYGVRSEPSAFMRKKRGPICDEGMKRRRSVHRRPSAPGTTIFARAAALRMRSFLPHRSPHMNTCCRMLFRAFLIPVSRMHCHFGSISFELRPSSRRSQLSGLRPPLSHVTYERQGTTDV